MPMPLPPMAAPPMLGVAPPPVGPRVPDPRAIADLKAGIAKLLDAADKDPILVAPALNPIIKTLIGVRAKLLEPPKPTREEAEYPDAGPLDHTPQGDVLGGNPLLSVLPRLMGAGMR